MNFAPQRRPIARVWRCNDYPKIDKKVYERTLEDYREMAWGDARCNWCMNQWGWNVKSSKYSEICPEFRYTVSLATARMGKFHIIRALLEGDFDH